MSAPWQPRLFGTNFQHMSASHQPANQSTATFPISAANTGFTSAFPNSAHPMPAQLFPRSDTTSTTAAAPFQFNFTLKPAASSTTPATSHALDTSQATVTSPFGSSLFAAPAVAAVSNPTVFGPALAQTPSDLALVTKTPALFKFEARPNTRSTVPPPAPSLGSSPFHNAAPFTWNNTVMNRSNGLDPLFVPTSSLASTTIAASPAVPAPIHSSPTPVLSAVRTDSEPSPQETNKQSSSRTLQQQLIALSLLNPYGNLGRKDVTSAIGIPPPKDLLLTPSSSATEVVSTTCEPAPIVFSTKSSAQKSAAYRSVSDIHFDLKPVVVSHTNNDNLRSTSSGQGKSSLASEFTEDEVGALLAQQKMFRLRVSKDIVDPPGHSPLMHSLYSPRRLQELETWVEKYPTTISDSPNIAPTPQQVASGQRSISPATAPVSRRSPVEANLCCLPLLERDGYYMKPTVSELRTLFTSPRHCIVNELTIGHEKHGSVTFYGRMNVAELNLDEIIEINRHEVIVYPDESNKPSIGEGLNRRARITLLGVYPIDRTTREEITDIDRIKAIQYDEYLRKLTEKFDGQFIHYGLADGSWTFLVQHFTRYGLDRPGDVAQHEARHSCH